MSWRSEALRIATRKERDTIKRLAGEYKWRTSFDAWIETGFPGNDRAHSREWPRLLIEALESMLQNQKARADALDSEQPATPEQLAAIERLRAAIRWKGSFNKWLQCVHGPGRIELRGQAERVIGALKDKLKAQLCGQPGEGKRDGSLQDCAYRR